MEPNPPESKDFLMKKIGPLPIAAYLVAAAALIGIVILRSRGSAQSAISPGPSVAAPTGITDPNSDQNQTVWDTLNQIQTQLSDIKTQQVSQPAPTVAPARPVSLPAWVGGIRRTGTVRAPATTTPVAPPRFSGPVAWQPIGAGGGEAPERILPSNFMRTPVHLDVEMRGK